MYTHITADGRPIPAFAVVTSHTHTNNSDDKVSICVLTHSLSFSRCAVFYNTDRVLCVRVCTTEKEQHIYIVYLCVVCVSLKIIFTPQRMIRTHTHKHI